MGARMGEEWREFTPDGKDILEFDICAGYWFS